MFKVSIKGLNEFKREFASASAKIKDVVSAEVRGAADEFVSGARRDVPIDQSTLKGSIHWEKEDDLSYKIVAQTFYAAFIEFGTKGKYKPIPGTEQIAAAFKGYKGGNFQEMLRMIAAWVHRKGLDPAAGLTGRYSVKTRRRLGSKATQQAEDLKVAWPIALSILKNGIKPHPFFFKQMDVVWPKMINNIEKALKSQTRASVFLPGELRKPVII